MGKNVNRNNRSLIEINEIGNQVEITNRMTDQDRKAIMDFVASGLESQVDHINSVICEIKARVTAVNPLNLMNYLVVNTYMMSMGKLSEADNSYDEDMYMRSIEYVQSVLVSAENAYIANSHKNDEESEYAHILELIYELNASMQQFYIMWAMKANREDKKIENDYIFEAEIMGQVRGTQYQLFRIPVLKALLNPHEDEIRNAYSIGVEDVIVGLETLEKNLSNGRMEAMEQLWEKVVSIDTNYEDMTEVELSERRSLVRKAAGLELCEVKKATKWPDILIDDLTWNLGENPKFYERKEYAGWPLLDVPTKQRPFIRIDGDSYCFDYYVLFDNFYRVFQKAVVKRNVDGINKWKEIQTSTSENLVAKIFMKILPGCEANIANYYPTAKKNHAENDVLIRYKDVLFVIEVKAGAFSPDPAILNFSSHKDALYNLVGKAEEQCDRTKKYIESNSVAIFYDGPDLKNETFRIMRDEYSQIYMIDVTIADFIDKAMQIEKYNFAKIERGIINISLNDLWVYMDYFDNPLHFIHFISQRVRATTINNLVLSDELDHLGAYIDNNMYTLTAENAKKTETQLYEGHRKGIDEYYSLRYIGESPNKPTQVINKDIGDILGICLQKKQHNVTLFSNFLLDMSYQARMQFSEYIHKLINREKELGRMIPVVAYGDEDYIMTVKIPHVEVIEYDDWKEYSLASIAKSGKNRCFSIVLNVDNSNQITDVAYDIFTQNDIPDADRKRLYEVGEKNAKNRAKLILKQTNKKKMYPNDVCYCGSGKKYKKCCGRDI